MDISLTINVSVLIKFYKCVEALDYRVAYCHCDHYPIWHSWYPEMGRVLIFGYNSSSHYQIALVKKWMVLASRITFLITQNNSISKINYHNLGNWILV